MTLKLGYKILNSLLPNNRSGDKFFALINFLIRHKRSPTGNPIFNDVLYKIKTTDEILNPLRVFISDKEYLKIYVKAIVGDEYNVPTIDLIRNIKDLEDYVFPSDCCIKPTHASGKVILRRNNEPINKEMIKSWFSINHYNFGREVNYKKLSPKVIIEPLIFNEDNLSDYRFLCHQGKVKLIFIDIGKYTDYSRLVLDSSWNVKDFSIGYPKSKIVPPKPDNLDEMIMLAEKLAAGFSFIRIDIYSNGKNCFVGEITNCHACANQIFIPISAEKIASDIIFS